ncbi:hypothetical protein [uncultured Bacteroides sp.]|nr:hypothetical protein [uncultured Bacteroides sp.]
MVKTVNLFLLLFCYVFAFYIGPVSVSLLIAVPLYAKAFLKKEFAEEVTFVLSTGLLKGALAWWFVLLFFSFLYPVLFLTFDYSFLRVTGMQGVHFAAAVPVLAYIRYKGFTQEETEKCFIAIFVVQTFIQLIVLNSEFLGNAIQAFNRFNPEDLTGAGSNIRGKALSAATTYHLTLAYGVCVIVYIKCLLSKRASLGNICIGVLIFVGIFFAGRSGFVACLIGAVGYLFYNKDTTVWRKLGVCVKILLFLAMVVCMLLAALSVWAPEFYALLTDTILPYAFEVFYSLDKSGTAETASTNQLAEMWKLDFNPLEFVFGSGRYSNPDGTYYMHVDPGLLRHLLFMGVPGYAALAIYQLRLLPFWKMEGRTGYYCKLILVFIFLLDLKGCTVGTNKFVMAITLLLSFLYLYLSESHPVKEKKQNEF